MQMIQFHDDAAVADRASDKSVYCPERPSHWPRAIGQSLLSSPGHLHDFARLENLLEFTYFSRYSMTGGILAIDAKNTATACFGSKRVRTSLSCVKSEMLILTGFRLHCPHSLHVTEHCFKTTPSYTTQHKMVPVDKVTISQIPAEDCDFTESRLAWTKNKPNINAVMKHHHAIPSNTV